MTDRKKAPKLHPSDGSPAAPAQAATVDAKVIQDPLQIRRSLGALAHNQTNLALRSPDGRHLGTGQLRAQAHQQLQLVVQPGPDGSPVALPASLHATGSGELGLLFFSLHGLARLAQGDWLAPWPLTLIQVQSRRHVRVSGQVPGLAVTLPGRTARVRLRDLSEDGIGLLLGDSDWATLQGEQGAQLHLGALSLPVPALQKVHGGPGVWAGPDQPAGARLVGMAAEDVQQLRRWLAAHLHRSQTARRDQA